MAAGVAACIPPRRARVAVLSSLLLVLLFAAGALATQRKAKQRRRQDIEAGHAPERRHPEPELWTYSVVQEYPHDSAAFTQGLQYDQECNDATKQCYPIFWESTGSYAAGRWHAFCRKSSASGPAGDLAA
jgi:glutamine cyclotransferase